MRDTGNANLRADEAYGSHTVFNLARAHHFGCANRANEALSPGSRGRAAQPDCGWFWLPRILGGACPKEVAALAGVVVCPPMNRSSRAVGAVRGGHWPGGARRRRAPRGATVRGTRAARLPPHHPAEPRAPGAGARRRAHPVRRIARDPRRYRRATARGASAGTE